MVFKKNEIIRLASGKKHIVVDSVNYNGEYYYYVCEVDKEEKNVIDSFQIITTTNEYGNNFIKTVTGDLAYVLEEIFKKNLGIN